MLEEARQPSQRPIFFASGGQRGGQRRCQSKSGVSVEVECRWCCARLLCRASWSTGRVAMTVCVRDRVRRCGLDERGCSDPPPALLSPLPETARRALLLALDGRPAGSTEDRALLESQLQTKQDRPMGSERTLGRPRRRPGQARRPADRDGRRTGLGMLVRVLDTLRAPGRRSCLNVCRSCRWSALTGARFARSSIGFDHASLTGFDRTVFFSFLPVRPPMQLAGPERRTRPAPT